VGGAVSGVHGKGGGAVSGVHGGGLDTILDYSELDYSGQAIRYLVKACTIYSLPR
jgi:hypothetical protein